MLGLGYGGCSRITVQGNMEKNGLKGVRAQWINAYRFVPCEG